MTRMLVVVRSAEDAAVAIDGGADRLVLRWSDAAGSPEPNSVEAIARAAARCPATLWSPEHGVIDLPALLERTRADEILESPTGPAGPGDTDAVRRVAVLPFAGGGTEPVFDSVASRGFAGVLFGEGLQPRRLLQVVTIGNLQQQVRWARARQLAIGFAGTMEVPDIPRLLAIEPDFLVFDDTVRQHGQPAGPINPERVRFVRELIPQAGTTVPASARSGPETIGRDRIFVRDWTVSIHLGAYEHERVAQRVRFTVEVDVVRTAARVSDLRDVVTYDLITDAISRATVEHVELVETIADDVANAILAHPRVTAVDIAVEKLDLGPGSLGCRVVRSRERLA